MKALSMPLGFGLVAVGSAFFAGLSYVNLWLATATLVADVLIIWLIVNMSRSIGSIEALQRESGPFVWSTKSSD